LKKQNTPKIKPFSKKKGLKKLDILQKSVAIPLKSAQMDSLLRAAIC
jgi:hypothetical protein